MLKSRGADTPVIVTTGHADVTLVSAAFYVGCNALDLSRELAIGVALIAGCSPSAPMAQI